MAKVQPIKIQVPKLTGVLAGIDLPSIVGDLTGIIQHVSEEVTDPRFQSILTTLATDAIMLASMKARAESPEDQALVAEAEVAMAARVQTISKVPGLMVAGRQAQILAMINRGLGMVVNTAFNFIRAYAGLPPAVSTPAA